MYRNDDVFSFPAPGPRVLSLYEGFFSGGARILHTAVIRALDATTEQQHRVLSLTDRVAREFTTQPMTQDTGYQRLVSAGIPVTALDRQSDATGTAPYTLADLVTIDRSVQDADVILSLKEQPLDALRLVGTRGRPLITCLHRSDPDHSGPALEALVDLYERGLLSAAICCAWSTQAAYHAATGIPLDRLPVIPNGVDLHKFRPDAVRRADVRASLGIGREDPVVLIAARFDEMKNIPLFVRAAGRFVRQRPDAHFILCGAGMSEENPALAGLLADELGSWDRAATNVHALGIQRAMAPFYNAADLVALTSAFGEAAPLCLLEGMASGAVPVTTAVGDAAQLVGDARLVTGPEPELVATTWAEAYADRDLHRERIARHRQRLSDQHGFDRYAALIAALAPQQLDLAV